MSVLSITVIIIVLLGDLNVNMLKSNVLSDWVTNGFKMYLESQRAVQ